MTSQYENNNWKPDPGYQSSVNDGMKNWNPPYETYQAQTSKQPEKPKKNRRNGKIAAFCGGLALFLALTFGAGYLGGSLAYQNQPQESGTSSGAQSAGTIQTGTNSATDTSGMTATQKVAALAADSVVEITTESVTTGNFFQQQIVSGAGSGVILSADGYIATNHHVVDGASKLAVTLRDGTQYEAELVGSDEKTDLAVIKIEASGLQPAVFGSSADLQVGELAVAIGNPLGQLGGTVTDGIISALDREITIDGEIMHLLQTSAAINAGNSGGGLFNASGELIGIVNAKSSGEGVEGLGFAIPSDMAKPVLEELMQKGYVSGRISLGMTLLDIDDVQTAMMYRVSSLGVYVLSVEDDSNAAKAGIESGDRIVSVNGTEISSTSDVTAILDQMSVGDQMEITIERSGRKGSATITLQEDKGSAA